MFRTFVTAAVLLALTVCPFRCAAGACGSDGANAEATHCPCCPPADGGEHETPSGDCGCQGICGGAVLTDAVEAPTTSGWAFSVAVLNESRSSVVTRKRAPAKDHGVVRSASGGMGLRLVLSSLLN
jgi:hypothetical protein